MNHNDSIQINFYHLTRSPLEKALPKLMEKVIKTNQRALVLSKTKETRDFLNQQLWTYTTTFFLPHGVKEEGFNDRQPIYLSHEFENPNRANIIAMVEDAVPDIYHDFDKGFYLFDGEDETAVQLARKRWLAFKKDRFVLKYWQQTSNGKWEEKAST